MLTSKLFSTLSKARYCINVNTSKLWQAYFRTNVRGYTKHLVQPKNYVPPPQPAVSSNIIVSDTVNIAKRAVPKRNFHPSFKTSFPKGFFTFNLLVASAVRIHPSISDDIRLQQRGFCIQKMKEVVWIYFLIHQ